MIFEENQMDQLLKNHMFCPLCGGIRSHFSVKPCRLCGHGMITLMQDLMNQALEKSKNFVPHPTNYLKDSFKFTPIQKPGSPKEYKRFILTAGLRFNGSFVAGGRFSIGTNRI